MSVDERVRCNSMPANADLSAGQYLGVEENSTGKAVIATVLGQAGVGILYNNPAAADRAAEVAVAGVAKGMAGAAIVPGAKVTVMANGRFQTAGSGHHVWGKYRGIANSVNGEIIEIDLDDTKPLLA